MIAMLHDNPVGRALAWVSAGLIALVVLLAVAWMLPPSGSVAGEGQGSGELSSDVPQIEPGEPIENYAVITNRPVFNESRQPVIGISDEQGDEGLAELENVNAPNVELAGVVITPDIRVATLRLKDTPESLVAVEGQPLEGDFGSWRVSRIEARQAVLESGSGEQVRLRLQIHDAVIDEPPETVTNRENRAVSQAANQAAQAEEDTPPISRAEEIRQRIAERREELKRQADEAEDQPAPVQPYRQAIQNMMQSRKDQEKDENEQ